NPAAVAGFSSAVGKSCPSDFSTKRLFPRPSYPQILLKSQKRMLTTKLLSANTAPAAVELEALCKQLGVVGFEKDMSDLRNRLVHTGEYGDFTFPEAVKLYHRLSHIISVCVLRLL